MVDVLLLGAFFFTCFVLFIFYLLTLRGNKSSKKKLLKHYNETKDSSKQGEEHRKRLLGEGESSNGRKPRTDKSKPRVKQFVKSERRQLLQTAVADKSRKNSKRIRETSKSPRGIFRKLRRK